MFRAAFHTGYVPCGVLRLTKQQLDGACADDRFHQVWEHRARGGGSSTTEICACPPPAVVQRCKPKPVVKELGFRDFKEVLEDSSASITSKYTGVRSVPGAKSLGDVIGISFGLIFRSRASKCSRQRCKPYARRSSSCMIASVAVCVLWLSTF